MADLANPLVPLHKLSKSIPHGFKGTDLLEMLWANSVTIERGVWFAKVIGANEMVSRSATTGLGPSPLRQVAYSTGT